MSDSETETTQTTNVSLVKEKKPRTPAQVEATNKALEALAQARRAKAEAKAPKEQQVVAKRTTTTTRIVKPRISKPKPVPADVVQSESPKPVSHTYNYGEDFKAFKDEIKGLLQAKKSKRKIVVEESSDDESSVEEVIMRKKKVRTQNPKPLAPTPLPQQPQPQQDNRNLLEHIFFRNH